jgi:hypothetical protein
VAAGSVLGCHLACDHVRAREGRLVDGSEQVTSAARRSRIGPCHRSHPKAEIQSLGQSQNQPLRRSGPIPRSSSPPSLPGGSSGLSAEQAKSGVVAVRRLPRRRPHCCGPVGKRRRFDAEDSRDSAGSVYLPDIRFRLGEGAVGRRNGVWGAQTRFRYASSLRTLRPRVCPRRTSGRKLG